MKDLDISKEFRIFRIKNGILLSCPEDHHHKHLLPSNIKSSPITVQNILELPCNIYFSDVKDRYQLVNDFCAESCGFDSSKSALNKCVYNTATPESAKIIYDNNHEVMKTNKIKIIEEELILNDGSLKQGLSIKLPWYNIHHVLIGIFGITIILGKQKLDAALSCISELGLLNQDHSLNTVFLNELYDDPKPRSSNLNSLPNIRLTHREIECLSLYMKGYSTKNIASFLELSNRTVDFYLENIKSKFGVNKRNELLPLAFALYPNLV